MVPSVLLHNRANARRQALLLYIYIDNTLLLFNAGVQQTSTPQDTGIADGTLAVSVSWLSAARLTCDCVAEGKACVMGRITHAIADAVDARTHTPRVRVKVHSC